MPPSLKPQVTADVLFVDAVLGSQLGWICASDLVWRGLEKRAQKGGEAAIALML